MTNPPDQRSGPAPTVDPPGRCRSFADPGFGRVQPAEWRVLVFDMARTGEPDDPREVSGFATLEHAREFARRRTRASVEELRTPGMPSDSLRRLWLHYGEDCHVVADGYRGHSELDRFIAEPAGPGECAWQDLA